DDEPCLVRRRLEKWKEHRRLRILGQIRGILPILYETNDLDSRPVGHLEVVTDSALDRAEYFACKDRIGDRDPWRALVIVQRQGSTRQERRFCRAEIVRRHFIDDR